MTEYWIFETLLGPACVAAGSQGIKYLLLPGWPAGKMAAEIESIFEDARPGKAMPALVRDAVELVQEYFKGNMPRKSVALDLSGLTDFQRRVLKAAMGIKPGETRSYSWVAEKAGRAKSCRAAAQALAMNPVPLFIPCHRVVGKDGSLTGFSSPGGLGLKRFMLELEKRRSGKKA